MRRAALVVVVLAFILWAVPRAWHYEEARAGAVLSERERSETSVVSGFESQPSRSESTYQGKPARWWARRAVQARKDANARGRTIRRLKQTIGRGFIPSHWLAIGSCESGLRWDYNGSSGFDGAVQFHPGTWSAYRLPSYPAFAYLASPFQQLVVAELVLARQGWRAWPACSRKLGFR